MDRRRDSLGGERASRQLALERHTLEQLPIAAGVGAQILLRNLYGCAKMRGRMPRPPRIIEHGARKCHEISIAGADDRLGLVISTDETDCDGGQIGRGLHGASEWHLIAWSDRDLLCRCQ